MQPQPHEPQPDIELLRCYCENDLLGILKPRAQADIWHGDAVHRWRELQVEILGRQRPGLERMTPRQWAAARCLAAVEALAAPFVSLPEHPDWLESDDREARRSGLADAFRGYLLHLTESESRTLVAPQPAPESARDEPQDVPATDGRSDELRTAKRRDLLAPLIEAAQRECDGSFDAVVVWPVLVGYAKALRRPLIGVCDEGIKWMDASDEARYFTLKNLRDRLRNKTKTAR